MTFSNICEISKIIALIFGLLLLVSIIIALIFAIFLICISEYRNRYYSVLRCINADSLKKRIDSAISVYPKKCDYVSGMRHVKEIIDHMVDGD